MSYQGELDLYTPTPKQRVLDDARRDLERMRSTKIAAKRLAFLCMTDRLQSELRP